MVEEKGKQAEERQDEPRLWRPWRPPRRRMGWRVLWAVGMVVVVLTTTLLIVDLHPEIWKDLLERRVLTLVALGLSLTAIVVMLAIAGAWRSWTGFQGKTVWDWLQLLIVPIVLSLITLAFAWQQDARQNDIEDRRAQAERELAEQRAQDEALQAYLDQMSTLLLEKDLRNSEEGSEVRILARARTLTVLRRLGSSGKGTVVQFLYEAGLIKGAHSVISLFHADLSNAYLSYADLDHADLSNADLSAADLSNANLSNANLSNANLSNANLSNANLSTAYLSTAYLVHANLRDAYLNNAHLSYADLDHADLSNADLGGADLSNTDLSYAYLSGYTDLGNADLSDAYLVHVHLSNAHLNYANLSKADLSDADLSGASLGGTNLSGAYLDHANLRYAFGWTEKQLAAAVSLSGATMPDGQKYEDWLKDKEGHK